MRYPLSTYRYTSSEDDPPKAGRDDNLSLTKQVSRPSSRNALVETPKEESRKSSSRSSSLDKTVSDESATGYKPRSSKYTADSAKDEQKTLATGTNKETSPTEKQSPVGKLNSSADSSSKRVKDSSTDNATSNTKSSTKDYTAKMQSKRTTSTESDTDYGSDSSRSSSLEITPSSKPEAASKQDTDNSEKVSTGRSRDKTRESYITKSDRLSKPHFTSSYEAQRDKYLDSSSKSLTLGRKSTMTSTSYSSTYSTSTLDRKRPPSSRLASSDVDALDPATVQSLEKLERLKRRDPHRPVTPEPESPKITQTKLLRSPERSSRRKSEGNPPIGHGTGRIISNVKPLLEEPETDSNDTIVSVLSSKSAEAADSTDIESAQSKTEDYLNMKKVKSDGVRDIQKKESISRTMSTPQRSSPDENKRGKYKSSTDNIYTIVNRTPLESAWGSFRSEKSSSTFRTKTKEDDSWRVKTPTSVSPVPPKNRYEQSPNTSRSNTPTSPPLRSGSGLKREDSFGSRSSTPTSPGVSKVADKWGREGGVNPRISYTAVKVDSTSEQTSSPTLKSSNQYVPHSKTPTPPQTTTLTSDVPLRPRLATSSGQDFRRLKPRDSEAMRAIKIEQRKTPVISPEALEALDMMLKAEDGEILETVEEGEEVTSKKTSLLKSVSPPKTPEKKVTINSEPSVVVKAPTPSTETRPSLGEQQQLSSETKDRPKSMSTFGDNREASLVCPEEGEAPSDEFSNSLNLRRSGIGSRRGHFRHSFSGGISTSLSMTDISQIGKKESKARRVGRSNSKRFIGHSAIDSYVSDTRSSPSHRPSGLVSSCSHQVSSSRTLATKNLSGRAIDTNEKKTERRFKWFK